MKNHIIFWILGVIVISAIGIFLLTKAQAVQVPSMGAENWMELTSLKQSYKLAGIMCLTGGNLFYSGIYLFIFIFYSRFNPKMRAKVAEYMTKSYKDYQGEINEETYKNMQDIAEWNLGVQEKAIQKMATNFVPDETCAKEVVKVKCLECGSLNDEDAIFCKKCGNKM